MENKGSTILDAIDNHIKLKPISFHVPGHKSGLVFDEKTSLALKGVLAIDLTELSGLDDLHSPEASILEAEVALAKTYQCRASFLLVNGSTVGNLSMIHACLKKGDQVLVQRNCHKSIMNGLRLVDATPIFLYQEVDLHLGVAKQITLTAVRTAICRFPKAKVIILTHPSYYGTVNDLEPIIRLAHEHHLIVLVDEAHGAHFIAGAPFPKSAIELGADIIVQSAHKTLPAMTMGSFLHVNSDRVELSKIRDYLEMFQSSSPSYPIMLSLDLARQFISNFTSDDVSYTVQQSTLFKDGLRRIDGLSVIESDDPIKVIVQSTIGVSGFSLQTLFEEVGVFTELADARNVLFILPLLKKDSGYPFSEALRRLNRLTLDNMTSERSLPIQPLKNDLPLTTLEYPMSLMDDMKTDFVILREALNRTSAEQITPYPPGIPLVHRGERIVNTVILHLEYLLNCGAKIQGGKQLSKGLIEVLIEER